MTMRVIRSRAARRDVIEHAVYIGQEDKGAAERFLDAVQTAYVRIGEFPKIGVERSFQLPALRGIRMWPVPGFERYLIFYRLEKDCIRIARLLNGVRGDIENAVDKAT